LSRFPFKGGVVLEADWNGKVLWEVRHPDHHHHGILLRNGNVLLHCMAEVPDDIARRVTGGMVESNMQSGQYAPRPQAEVGKMYSDYLAEVTPAGQTVWQWRTWEHLDPAADGIAEVQAPRTLWAQGNSVYELPDGDILASYRPTSTVIRISRKTGKIVWKLGPPTVAGQHAPTLLENGNVLIFDNGPHRLDDAVGQKFTLRLLQGLARRGPITIMCHCDEDQSSALVAENADRENLISDPQGVKPGGIRSRGHGAQSQDRQRSASTCLVSLLAVADEVIEGLGSAGSSRRWAARGRGRSRRTRSTRRVAKRLELSRESVPERLDHLGDVILSAKIRFVVVSNVPCSWLIFPFIDPRLREGEGGWFSAPLVPSWCWRSVSERRGGRLGRSTTRLLRPIRHLRLILGAIILGSRFRPSSMTMTTTPTMTWSTICKTVRSVMPWNLRPTGRLRPAGDTGPPAPIAIGDSRVTATCRRQVAKTKTTTPERALTTACPEAFRPARPVRPNRMQFGSRQCGRDCRSAPVRSVRDQSIRV
jgi:arylsulfotransferase ASST